MGLTLWLLACDPGGEPTPGGKDADPADTATSDSGDSGDTGPPPVDADADGFNDTVDCDDADAALFPGAPDWCDGIDQDCDGDPVGDGMCGDWATIEAMGTAYWQGEFASERFSGGPYGVFDGDVLNIAHVVDRASGAGIKALFQGVPSDTHGWSEGAVGSWSNRVGANEVDTITHAGDFDGDGHDDLWLFCGDFDYPRNDYRLQLGPWTGWPASGVYADEVDDAVWYETAEANETLDASPGPGRDVDGDGLADFVNGAPRGVTVLLGRLEAWGYHDPTDEPWLAGEDSNLRAYIGADVDGDGMREVLLRGPGDGAYLGWIDGTDLAMGSGEPLPTVQWELPMQDGWVGVGYNLGSTPDVGDVDGDGVPDILAQVGTWSGYGNEPACAVWLSAAALPTAATVEDAKIARACWLAEGQESELYGGSGDIDGDGVLDPRFVVSDHDVYIDRGWYQVGCPLGTTRLELGGTLDASTVSPCYYGYGTTVPDLDGDGLDDHAVYNMEWLAADTENYGRTDILFGFEIPWDDPSKW